MSSDKRSTMLQQPQLPSAAVGDHALESEAREAEALLHDLAIMLRRVAVRESTRRPHVRALELKAQVARWLAERPCFEQRARVFGELRELAQAAARVASSDPMLAPRPTPAARTETSQIASSVNDSEHEGAPERRRRGGDSHEPGSLARRQGRFAGPQ